jgi:hypothetical protein
MLERISAGPAASAADMSADSDSVSVPQEIETEAAVREILTEMAEPKSLRTLKEAVALSRGAAYGGLMVYPHSFLGGWQLRRMQYCSRILDSIGTGESEVSERFRLIPLRNWLFTPDLQRQSRGQ